MRTLIALALLTLASSANAARDCHGAFMGYLQKDFPPPSMPVVESDILSNFCDDCINGAVMFTFRGVEYVIQNENIVTLHFWPADGACRFDLEYNADVIFSSNFDS